MVRFLVAAVVALGSAIWISSAHAAPQITSVSPSSGPTSGGSVITISGTGFGAAGNVVAVGAAQCPVTAETTDQIECTLPEGSGASRPIRVVGGGQASPPFPFGYAPPSITDVTAASFPTAGGVRITINGENFGNQQAAIKAFVLSDDGTGEGRSCSGVNVDIDHVRITCTLPPGTGRNRYVVEAIIDGVSSTDRRISYDPPAISGVTPTRGASIGGTLLTISGTNFGSDALVTVGGSSCPVDSQTDTSIECTLPPPSGAPPTLHVTVSDQASNDVTYSYQPVASKCDAAKFKAEGSYAQCLANAEASGAKKGLDASSASVTKCDDKFAASCGKAESKLDDCSQPASCATTGSKIKHKGWDGLIYGHTR